MDTTTDAPVDQRHGHGDDTTRANLNHRFAFHAASRAEKAMEHATVRSSCLDLALMLDELLPPGREKSLAMTHLEEVMLWGNAAIARNL